VKSYKQNTSVSLTSVLTNGVAFSQINEVALRWTRLVLGWVTFCKQINHLGTKPAS